jgi:predicted nucleic acid-binding protein
MIVVSDASPLLNLAIIGQLNLLSKLYGKVVVPPAVYDEATVSGMPGTGEVRTAPWIVIKQVENQPLVTAIRLQIDRGEAEAIALATEIQADLLLVDERKARAVANRFNLRFTGLMGILIEAKQKGHIPAIKPVIDRLRTEANFWISEPLYKQVLQTANE